MNVILFANWGLGKLVLENFIKKNDINILCVVTQANKDINDVFYNMVNDYALSKKQLVFHSYSSIPNDILKKADFGLSISYSEIFKDDILKKIRIFNLHPSLLPLFRGPSPLNWQIKNGQEKIGATIHIVDDAIDEGYIYAQKEFAISSDLNYNEYVDELNICMAEWVANETANMAMYPSDRLISVEKKKEYFHRLFIPSALKATTVKNIHAFLNRKRIIIYSGNRAEFGIILPLIEKLSEQYNVDLVLSGAHIQEPWQTKREVYSAITEKKMAVNIIEIPNLEIKNYYRDNFNVNFNFGISFIKKYSSLYPAELLVVLGDRVETYAFANAAFFSQLPICHMYGGDMSNVPYFDTNIRHAITKLASLHLCSNEQSYINVLNMGEEDWRVGMIGNTSLDNYTINNYTKKEDLIKLYGLKDTETVLFTYHASQFVSVAQNFSDFKKILDIIIDTDIQTVITYPNNDEGHEKITEFLNTFENTASIKVVNNLGIKNYLGLIKEFNTIVAGNTSSGIFETVLYGRPALNIGDRQTDRPRAKNVIDVSLKELDALKFYLIDLKNNYSKVVEKNLDDRYFFGSGNSVSLAVNKINEFLQKPKKTQVLKKFIARK